jgi:hypothetical protein
VYSKNAYISLALLSDDGKAKAEEGIYDVAVEDRDLCPRSAARRFSPPEKQERT